MAHSGLCCTGVGNTLATFSGIACGPVVSYVLNSGSSWTKLFRSASVAMIVAIGLTVGNGIVVVLMFI